MQRRIPNLREHESFRQLIKNIDDDFSKIRPLGPAGKMASIWGHGNEGHIITGNGRHLDERKRNTYIGLKNEHRLDGWKSAFLGFPPPIHPHARRVRAFPTLALCGCYVGAGYEGALLLHKLARASSCYVVAPIGLITCLVVAVTDGGAPWQRAAPDRPMPKPMKAVKVNKSTEKWVSH